MLYQEDLLYKGADYSIFTVLDGMIELENQNSNLSMYLSNGETIVSTETGKFFRLDTFRQPQGIVNSLLEFR